MMAGKLFVPPDYFASLGTYIDPVTGLISSQISFPSGEQGSWIPTVGRMIFGVMGDALLTDKITEIQLLDDTLTSYLTNTSLIVTNYSEFAPFTNNRSNRYYAIRSLTTGTPTTIATIDIAGVVGGTTWTLPADTAHVPQCASVNLAETKLYYGSSAGIGAKIHVWNLLTDSADTDFYTGSAGEIIGADLYTLADGSLIFTIRAGAGNTWEARHYSSLGVLLQTYAIGTSFNGTLSPPRICLEDDEATLWAMSFPNSNMLTSRFTSFNVSTGVAGTPFNLTNFDPSPSFAYRQNNTGKVSQSCPLFFISDTPPPTTATLTITKVTVPPGSLTEFGFVTAGLSPDTFTLADGDSQVYSSLDPGTYGVTETIPDGWTTDYDVSNGDPHTAIRLAAGDDVTVTVTNTQGANTGSGIYKIVADKRNDTLWVNVDSNIKTDVKIPDPSHKTGLIGD